MPLPLMPSELLRAAQRSQPSSFHMGYAVYEELFSHHEAIEIRCARQRAFKEPEDFWVACIRAVGKGDWFEQSDDLNERLRASVERF